VELAAVAEGVADMTLHVCLLGVESTGKTTLGRRVARQLGGRFLREYGREYAETIGTEFSAVALRTIARIHTARRQRLLATRPRLLIEDTDVVMTAAWFRMLNGRADPVLSAMPATADVYLLFAPDTPWVDDGTRRFVGPERAAFARAIDAELAARGITPVLIGGDWPKREAALVAAISARLDSAGPSGS
jgi:NadR type nicotinamide-nucleotide adenylyltransferase